MKKISFEGRLRKNKIKVKRVFKDGRLSFINLVSKLNLV